MKLVLLSGGSGKRLWPLSNDARSKQFLKVLEGKNGEKESMVQRVWGQLGEAGLQENTMIATSKAQVDMLQSQLGQDVSIITEPERRDTFPAIALAAAYLYSIQGVELDEVVLILPVDPYVDDQFFHRIKDIEEVLSSTETDIGLVGVTPTYPSEKYGYIVPEAHSQESSSLPVSYFREKPSEKEAAALIEKGALWNCGVFAFKLDYMISFLEEKGLPIQYEELLKQYSILPKNSFDYEVVEKTKNIAAIPYDGYWKDLGTWNTLTEEMTTSIIGKGKMCEASTHTHIVNELDIPVAVLGLRNTVVAVSPDGILVTEKEASPKVKDAIKDLVQRPMFEERRWGWYRVLDYTKQESGNEILTKRIGVAKGKNLSYQLHLKRSEVWTIIKGEGEFALNDEIRKVEPGDVLEIPVGAKHGIKANEDLEFIEVQQGSELIEEDIIRIYMNWEEVEGACAFARG